MTATDQIDALRALYSPDMARVAARINDPDFPNAQEVADAEHALAQPAAPKQPSLELSRP